MYALLLKVALEDIENKANFRKFESQYSEILNQRQDWVREIPVQIVREKISGLAPGLYRKHKETSIKHHYDLRRQWARHLGHLDKDGKLTDTGQTCASSITSATSKNSMFWIAPANECVKKIGIPLQDTEWVHTAWDLFRPCGPESEPTDKMVQLIAEFMRNEFEPLRLKIFAQAPLAAIMPYIYFQEICLNQKVNIHAALAAVLRKHKKTFYCTLTKNIEECYYQLHASPNTGRKK